MDVLELLEGAADAATDAAEQDGPCAVCADAGVERASRALCVACESRVCAEHHRALYSLCKRCATDERLAAGRAEPAGESPREYLGIKWVED